MDNIRDVVLGIVDGYEIPESGSNSSSKLAMLWTYSSLAEIRESIVDLTVHSEYELKKGIVYILESYEVSVGISAAGEIACDMTMDAIRIIHGEVLRLFGDWL